MLKRNCRLSLPDILFNNSVTNRYLSSNILSPFNWHHLLFTRQWTQTSLRRLQDVLKRSRRLTTKSDVVKTSGKSVLFTSSWRRPIYDVLKTSDLQRLKDVWFKTSWRRPIYVVLMTSNLRRLEDVWFTTSGGSLIYNSLKTSDFRCLEEVQFTTSSGRLIYDVFRTSNFLRLEDVRFASSWRRPIYDVFKTSVKQRLCSNVVVTSIQRQKKWFFLILYCLKYSEKFKCSCLG